jgi:hypothetical protein
MGEQTKTETCQIGDLVAAFLQTLGPVHERYDSVAEAWHGLLPENLRSHCRVAGLADGCLRITADGSSYLYELQLCRPVLLRELQRLCPAARVRRIEVAMAR